MFSVKCRMNSDCGQITEVQVCYNGDVHIDRITPSCQSPNTPYAKCVNTTRLSQNPIERCGDRCAGGECVN